MSDSNLLLNISGMDELSNYLEQKLASGARKEGSETWE